MEEDIIPSSGNRSLNEAAAILVHVLKSAKVVAAEIAEGSGTLPMLLDGSVLSSGTHFTGVATSEWGQELIEVHTGKKFKTKFAVDICPECKKAQELLPPSKHCHLSCPQSSQALQAATAHMNVGLNLGLGI